MQYLSGSAGDGSKERSIFSVLQQTYVSMDRREPNIESEESAELSSQVDTFEGSELEKALRESAAKTEAPAAGGEGGLGRGRGGVQPDIQRAAGAPHPRDCLNKIDLLI